MRPTASMYDFTVEQALRTGKWERFEHPEKGDTVTLFLGNVAIFSIHNNLLYDNLQHSLKSALRLEFGSESVGIALLVRNAQLEAQLNAAIERIVELESR